MASIDLQYVRQRRREIHETIARSSPVLIYSGKLGIVVIAANKSKVRHRVGKILDRMAVVSRGELTASDIIHKVAAAEAHSLAHALSRGDVLGQEPVQAVGSLLSRHFHAFLGEPLAAESCVVKLNATPDDDYLAHISPDGSVQLFEQIQYLGTGESQAATQHRGQEKEQGREHVAQEQLNALNDELRRRYNSEYASVAELFHDMEQVPGLAQLFTAGRSRDVVILDRAAFLRRDFDDIFKRLSL